MEENANPATIQNGPRMFLRYQTEWGLKVRCPKVSTSTLVRTLPRAEQRETRLELE